MNPSYRILAEDAETILRAPFRWADLDGKRVLVTGGAGMLAAYVVRTLVALRHIRGIHVEVLALVRDRARAEAQFADLKRARHLSIIEADVCSPQTVEGAIDAIFHAASPASPKFYSTDPIGVLLPNTIGTERLLRLAERQQSCRFLFVSSPDVYGYRNHPPISALREDSFGSLDPLELRACYAESKRMGEAMCAAWWRQKGIGVRLFRPSHSYGPGMRLDDGRIFADLVSAVVQRREIVLKTDGQATRALCYLTDAIEGLFAVFLEGTDGEAYNLVNMEGLTKIVDLANMVARLVPGREVPVVHRPDPDYHPSPVSATLPLSVAKIAALGWSPKVTLADGFRRTIESFLGRQTELGRTGKAPTDVAQTRFADL